jgi:hypothetical protein
MDSGRYNPKIVSGSSFSAQEIKSKPMSTKLRILLIKAKWRKLSLNFVKAYSFSKFKLKLF